MKRFITGSFLVLMSILSGFPVQAGKSLDEIDRESFAAKYILSELPGISMIPVWSIQFEIESIFLSTEHGSWPKAAMKNYVLKTFGPMPWRLLYREVYILHC